MYARAQPNWARYIAVLYVFDWIHQWQENVRNVLIIGISLSNQIKKIIWWIISNFPSNQIIWFYLQFLIRSRTLRALQMLQCSKTVHLCAYIVIHESLFVLFLLASEKCSAYNTLLPYVLLQIAHRKLAYTSISERSVCFHLSVSFSFAFCGKKGWRSRALKHKNERESLRPVFLHILFLRKRY